MQATIERIVRQSNGTVYGIISVNGASMKIYRISNSVTTGMIVNYELKRSQYGNNYANYLSTVENIDEVQETEDIEATASLAQTTNASGIGNATIEELLHIDLSQYKTVSQLNSFISDTYAGLTAFSNIWVQGEITNYSGSRDGNYYFDIKDENSKISCKLWANIAPIALNFVLEKGQKVAIKGKLEYYKKDGNSSIIVREILNIGEGDANLRYRLLKERLTQEGIFDIAHHKPVSMHAKRVGILTSKDGQAIKDIRKVANERNPYVQLVLYNALVQGKRAVDSMLAGLARLDRENLDVIIIGRGGGSDEDLLIYDDERLVRAIYAANTPIVSAVGHEGHWPLVDGVADERFATPTDAAQHVIFDILSEIKRVAQLKEQIQKKTEFIVQQRKLKVTRLLADIEKNSPQARLNQKITRLELARDQLNSRITQVLQYKMHRVEVARLGLENNHPRKLVAERLKLAEAIEQNLKVRMNRIFDERNHRCQLLIAELNGLSPTAKLVSGFGYISSEGKAVTSVDSIKVGDNLTVKIHDGEIDAQVVNINNNKIEI